MMHIDHMKTLKQIRTTEEDIIKADPKESKEWPKPKELEALVNKYFDMVEKNLTEIVKLREQIMNSKLSSDQFHHGLRGTGFIPHDNFKEWLEAIPSRRKTAIDNLKLYTK